MQVGAGEWQETARAKVNLTLRVLGRRPDGYHVLESLVAFADVGDRLTLRRSETWNLVVNGPFAAALEGDNLVDRAAASVAAEVGRPLPFALTLEKRLPVAAGIGGGSADAAAALRLLRRALGDGGAHLPWQAIAAKLGADVPVCFSDRSAVMGGMGDHLLPLRGALALPAVLIRPAIDVPANKTAAVFRALRAGSVAGPLPSLTEPADIASALSAQGNDLQAAAMAVMPPIAEALDALLACRGATQARLSGAGPTLFALFATQQQAGAAARQLAAQRPRDWIVTTILR